MPGSLATIFPINFANSQIVMTVCQETNLHSSNKFSALSGVSLIVIFTEFNSKPKNDISCVGTKTDFSWCTVNPNLSTSNTVSLMFSKQSL